MNKEQQKIFDYVSNLQPISSDDELETFIDSDYDSEIEGQNDEDYKHMTCVNAPAGTGKTFLIKKIYKEFKNIKILAPTHKACSLFNEAGIKADSIHKFFCSKQEIDKNDGSRSFLLYEPHNIENIDIIIVDECSMVSNDMLDSFILIKKNIIFFGDDHQIPPIGEIISPVFKKVKNKFTLIKNMRSRDSFSNIIIQKFREAIDQNKKIRVDEKIPINDMLEMFKENKDCVALAWTNNKVKNLNDIIRNYLFNNNKNDEIKQYYVNEVLIFSGYRLCSNIAYYSNSEVKIINLEIINLDIPFHKCNCMIDNEKLKSCEKHGIKSRNHKFYNLTFYKITDIYSNEWFKVIEKDLPKLKKITSDYKSHCIKMKDKKIWNEYYKFIEFYDPELNYSYSMTVHKAQGSQWQTVFVDIYNIRISNNLKQVNKLTYTAMSRMIDVVYFI